MSFVVYNGSSVFTISGKPPCDAIAAVTDMGGIPDLDADRRWLLAVGYWLLAG
jgi:hypothetical protein